MAFNNFLSCETNAILNVDKSFGAMNVVELNNILSFKTTTVFNVDLGFCISKCGKEKKDLDDMIKLTINMTALPNNVKIFYLQRQNKEQIIKCDIKKFQNELAVKASDANGIRLELNLIHWPKGKLNFLIYKDGTFLCHLQEIVKYQHKLFCKLFMVIKEWNSQEFHNLYCNIKEQCLQYCLCIPAYMFGCVFFHLNLRTNSISLLPFQVAFLVPSLVPNDVLADLPSSTPNSVPRLQPTPFPTGVMSLRSKSTTSPDPSSFFTFVPILDSNIENICAPGQDSSTVPRSFPSIESFVYSSVSSVFSFAVPSGDSSWTTGFTYSSV